MSLEMTALYLLVITFLTEQRFRYSYIQARWMSNCPKLFLVGYFNTGCTAVQRCCH